MKNKAFLIASMMTFCFAKVDFNVGVHVGSGFLNKTDGNVNTKKLKQQWLWSNDAGSTNVEYHTKDEASACSANNSFYSTDGGKTWEVSDDSEANKARYREYVTNRASEYQMEGDGERYGYTSSGIMNNNSRGNVCFGLDGSIGYNITPKIKIGAQAFITSTNLKQDISYTVTPHDIKGNDCYALRTSNQEIQMYLGSGYAVYAGGAVTLNNCDTNYVTGVKVTDAVGNKKLGLASETTGGSAGDRYLAVYGLQINLEGYNYLKNLRYGNNHNTIIVNNATTYGAEHGFNIVKVGAALNNGVGNSDDAFKNHIYTLNRVDGTPNEIMRNWNFKTVTSDAPVQYGDNGAVAEHLINNAPTMQSSVGLLTQRTADPAVAGDAAGDKTTLVALADNDKIVFTEETYNQIMSMFEKMESLYTPTKIDRTLDVKHIWGGMLTLEWAVTDCTHFVVGAGVGIADVKKFDNLKSKVGFSGMCELRTKITDTLSVGMRYQMNQIKLKTNDTIDDHSIAKLKSNFHMISANLSYTF